MSLTARFFADLDAMLDALAAEGVIPADAKRQGITLEPPRDPSHGDLSTNAAMVLAKQARTNPRALAEQLVPRIEAHDDVESVEVAGPGFINIRLARGAWERELETILADAENYGKSTIGKGETVNIEYVSANPTGPMHMGHSRGAVVGDALARLLEAAGYDVVKEYYVNDAGAQVDTLARSAHLRYREALGEEIGEIPEGLYPGDYLVPVGKALAEEFGDTFKDAPESEWLQIFKEKAAAAMMDLVRKDLALLGVEHDAFASEAELQASGQVDAAMDALRAKGLVYEGVLEPPKGQKPDDWEPVELTLFKSSEFGDDQDRPMKKSDGSWTYFGADAAYHRSKVEGWASGRKADHLVNIWGADHAGTVKRVQSAVTALTDGKVDLDVKLVQMVQLMKGGKPFKMSKRAGNFVTLADVVEMVGKDVVRFTMLTRKPDAQMDFDFDKVVEASKDNPVFYVQYAHARISSVMRRVKAEGVEVGEPDYSRLNEGDLALIKQAANFPRVVEQAALAHEPHRIAFYLYDLAAAFHAGWNRGNDDPAQRFIVEGDPQLTAARLELARGIGQVIRNGLAIMGVEAAEEMR